MQIFMMVCLLSSIKGELTEDERRLVNRMDTNEEASQKDKEMLLAVYNKYYESE